mgnify:CR=1 FL=1
MGYFQEAVIKLENIQYYEAIELLEMAIRSNNIEAKYNYQKGLIFFLMADYDIAIEENTLSLKKTTNKE